MSSAIAPSRHLADLIASRQPGYSLPRPFYHDSDLYALEMRTIWRRGWLFAGFTCQIPLPGDFLTLTLDGDSILILRDDDGAVRAFHNVCTHRGTVLCEEESGHSRALVCPYHQWTFSRRGELLKCHGMQEDLDKSILGLRPISLELCAGLIYISLAEQPLPFESARQTMAPAALPQGFEHAKPAKIVDYEIQANWKLVWENNRECYHCNVNHPQYIKSNFDIFEDGHGSPLMQERLAAAMARAVAAAHEDGTAIDRAHGGLYAFPDAAHNLWYSANRTVLVENYESESLDGRRVAPLMGDYRDASAGVLRLRSLPNFWNHSSCDHVVTTRLLPGGLHRTFARVIWFVDADAAEGVDYHLDALLPFWQLTSEQDWALCERVQRGVTSSAYRPGPLSKTREYNLDAFLNWYLHQLGE